LLNDVNNNRVNDQIFTQHDQINNLYVQIPKNGDRIEAYGVWVTDNLAGGWE